MTLILIGGGIFFIANANFNSLANPVVVSNTTKTSTTSKGQIDTYDISNLKPGIPIIVGMIFFTVLLAMVFLLLLIKFTKCVFYTLIIGGLVLLLAFTIMLFVMGQVIGGVVALIVFLIYLLALWCSREKIKIGVVLLQTAASFVANKSSVFLVPLFMAFIVLIFEIFWLISVVGISLYKGNAKTQQEIDNQEQVNSFFVLVWGFLQMFYSFFFHYCSVFLVATAAAMWYYNVDGNYICTGFKRIFANHLGSFTFAAFILAIVATARQSAKNRSN